MKMAIRGNELSKNVKLQNERKENNASPVVY